MFNFARHYTKHANELSKFGIKSMDDYLSASTKFLGKTDKLIFTDLKPFHKIVDSNGDILFFNPHNKLLAILDYDNAGQYIKSFYTVSNKFKFGKLLNRVLGKSIFWLWDLFGNWRWEGFQIQLPLYSCP